MNHLVDHEGYRPNVGIILCNHKKELFWAQRSDMDAWQFPQGGIDKGEDPKEAMYRELKEEIGLRPQDVVILGQSKEWVKYLLDDSKTRFDGETYIGQKQIWFLLKLITDETHINIGHSDYLELNDWKWVDYWYPADHIVEFKRENYKKILTEFEPLLP